MNTAITTAFAMPPSLWAATAPPAPATVPLAGTVRADVAVVGAGFTGLSAAHHLAEAGVKTVVLEQAEIGWGASGRNNGQVIPTLSRLDPEQIVAAVPRAQGGREKGEALVALIRDSAALVFDLIRRHGIEAEAVQNGWIQPAHRPSRLAVAEKRVRQWGDRGAPVRMLDRAAMAALTGTEHWFGGWENRSGGRINPLGLARGLATTAMRAGAAVHTASPVLRIGRLGSAWVLETPRGSVLAERVIVATHADTGDVWPGLARSVVRVRSYQMATAPLSENLRRSILPEGHALSDTRGDLYFYRFDAGGRLVTGGGLILPVGWERRIRARIGARMRRVFPQIGEGLRFDYVWWGHLAATDDRMPHVFELAPGVLSWMGCNGRGVALAVTLGRELAKTSTGTPLRDVAAPVEPLRTIRGHAASPLGAAAMVALNRWRDRRD